MKKFLLIVLIVFTFCIIKTSSQEYDSLFNPSFIISDYELEDYSSMNVYDIQAFLNRQAGQLKNYITKDPDSGRLISAAEIIYNASQKYKINPKYLIVLLQKEQSLITDPNPTQKQFDWAMGFAICDSCAMNDPALQKYKGFYNQVFYAAQRNRFYIENKDLFWLFQVGREYNIDGIKISPINQATVNLYNYTPHYNGNYNFWKIWQKWFTKKYPNGSIIKAHGSPGVWIIEEGYKKPFITWSSFISRYKKSDIIDVSYSDLEKYPIGDPIKFENYSYLRTPDGSFYMVDNDKLRKFETRETARYFGVNPEEAINVSIDDINYYPKGENITLNSLYPNGIILQNIKDQRIYYVKDGKKSLILNNDLLKINYPNQAITKVSDDEIDKLESADNVIIRDGVLVKSHNNNAVYFISDGFRKPILSEDIFEKLGFSWGDIISISDNILNLNKLGDAITIIQENINENELLPTQESHPL
ncbi:MAG TPA: hypothetical protein PKL13_00095 [bacterium]|mgnify:CR=1 FL=1|nr:hypothetical protein [bacterium]